MNAAVIGALLLFALVSWLFVRGRARPSPTIHRAAVVHDAVLGDLLLTEDASAWSTTLDLGGRRVELEVRGREEPDPALLAHAQAVVRDFPAFQALVRAFLEAVAEKQPYAAVEIRLLAINAVCLWSSEGGPGGMIFFDGPDEDHLWRCDYVNAEPRDLGFDS